MWNTLSPRDMAGSSLPNPFSSLKVTTITEIQAYALGARYLLPEARTVLDIGGQDTKVIRSPLMARWPNSK